jgi:hypothetical protein
MSHNEFNELRHTVAALPPEQMRQLRDELDLKLSALPAANSQGSLGAMQDAAEELDEVVEHAMQLRRQPWRALPGE